MIRLTFFTLQIVQFEFPNWNKNLACLGNDDDIKETSIWIPLDEESRSKYVQFLT